MNNIINYIDTNTDIFIMDANPWAYDKYRIIEFNNPSSIHRHIDIIDLTIDKHMFLYDGYDSNVVTKIDDPELTLLKAIYEKTNNNSKECIIEYITMTMKDIKDAWVISIVLGSREK